MQKKNVYLLFISICVVLIFFLTKYSPFFAIQETYAQYQDCDLNTETRSPLVSGDYCYSEGSPFYVHYCYSADGSVRNVTGTCPNNGVCTGGDANAGSPGHCEDANGTTTGGGGGNFCGYSTPEACAQSCATSNGDDGDPNITCDFSICESASKICRCANNTAWDPTKQKGSMCAPAGGSTSTSGTTTGSSTGSYSQCTSANYTSQCAGGYIGYVLCTGPNTGLYIQCPQGKTCEQVGANADCGGTNGGGGGFCGYPNQADCTAGCQQANGNNELTCQQNGTASCTCVCPTGKTWNNTTHTCDSNSTTSSTTTSGSATYTVSGHVYYGNAIKLPGAAVNAEVNGSMVNGTYSQSDGSYSLTLSANITYSICLTQAPSGYQLPNPACYTNIQLTANRNGIDFYSPTTGSTTTGSSASDSSCHYNNESCDANSSTPICVVANEGSNTKNCVAAHSLTNGQACHDAGGTVKLTACNATSPCNPNTNKCDSNYQGSGGGSGTNIIPIRIIDKNKKLLPGAQLTATDHSNGNAKHTSTSQGGTGSDEKQYNYTISNLPASIFEVCVTTPPTGFTASATGDCFHDVSSSTKDQPNVLQITAQDSGSSTSTSTSGNTGNSSSSSSSSTSTNSSGTSGSSNSTGSTSGSTGSTGSSTSNPTPGPTNATMNGSTTSSGTSGSSSSTSTGGSTSSSSTTGSTSTNTSGTSGSSGTSGTSGSSGSTNGSSGSTNSTNSNGGTPTPSPLPCSVAAATGFSVVVKIPGIGQASGDNTQPVHNIRATSIFLLAADSQGLPVPNTTPIRGDGNLQFNGGTFTGALPVSCGLAAGNYLVMLRMDNTLTRQVSRKAFAVTPGQVNDLSNSPVELVPGDLNIDNRLDLTDYNILIGCFGNKLCNKKDLSDLNDDGKVDEKDINIFLRGLATEAIGN